MNIFYPTLNQMGFLFSLILIGFILAKCGAVPASAAGILSKLENNLFIPALVLGTFMKNFTAEKLSSFSVSLAVSAAVLAVTLPLGLFLSKLCSKDKYIRKLYIYGLVFPNFGFMGNAVVAAVFPDIFMEYLIFTFPLWIAIYVWGVPSLLIPAEGKKQSFADRIKPLFNPMFICLIIGAAIGLSGIAIPQFLSSVITVSGDCMSPIAMLLTGITVAGIDFKKTFADKGIYLASVLRLLIIPLAFIGILYLLRFSPLPKLPDAAVICTVCSLSMPLGLNTIVVPGAYGKDTSAAAGMAIVSHLFSCITIPAMFFLMFEILL